MDWGVLIAFIILKFDTVSLVSIRATSNGTRVSPGNTVHFTCLVSGLQQDLMTQVYKTRVILETPTGRRIETPIGSDRWQIANNSVINYALADATDRYVAEEDENEQGTIHVFIRDTGPEDSGFYGCRLIRTSDDYVFLQSQELRIEVIGDVVDHILFLRSQDSSEKEILASGSDIVLQENIKKNIECEFSVSNVMPVMDIYIGGSTKPLALNVSDDFYYLEQSEQKSSSVGLVSQSYFYHFKNRHRYPKVKYHRQRVTCHTEIKSWKHYDIHVNILVKASPRNTTCVPPGVSTTIGSKVSITCTTWSYPEATSVWKLPNGTAIYTERMQAYTAVYRYTDDTLTSILSFIATNESDFGKYSLTIQNEIGMEITHINIKMGNFPSAHDSTTCNQISAFVLTFNLWLNFLYSAISL